MCTIYYDMSVIKKNMAFKYGDKEDTFTYIKIELHSKKKFELFLDDIIS